MKKFLSLTMVCTLTLCLAGVGGAEAAKRRSAFGTGNSGGVFYILGAGMADLINKNSKVLELTAQSTSGTTENLNLTNAGEIDFAFTVYDTAYFAYTGGREYEGKKKLENIRLVMMGHVGLHMTTVFANSPYKTMGDMKGKTIPTSPGITSLMLDQASWKPWGVEIIKGKAPILTYSEQTTAMKDGTIEVANYNMANPASTIMDLASTKPIRILGQTEESMAQILKEHPYWLRSIVPANTYTGQTEDVVVLGFPYAIMCNKDVPDEAVRDFLRISFENDLTTIHPEGSYYGPKNKSYTANPLLPYHPAAAAFLKEKGMF